jgi:glutathione-regulated potassium-efflux system protein KefB
MDLAGLSMAMGAFLAGVMLSTSSYRHQIESDIEPFRGLLMGLFFLAVGMSLDLAVVAAEWSLLLSILAVFIVAKGAVVYAVARLFGSSRNHSLHRTSMFLQGGEFAFVLFTAATSGGVIDARESALFATVIIFSMALTPLLMMVADRLLRSKASMDGVDAASDLRGRILIIGFGRFGQIASQALLAKGVDLSVIDNNPDRIRDAARYGFKVFFGDGARLDTLHHSGASSCDVVMICVDDRASSLQIVELVKHAFPQAKLLARSYDRKHAVELIRAGVDYQIRETVESAYSMGSEGLRAVGFSESDVEEATQDIRRRDEGRLSEQVQGDEMSGRDRLLIQPVPEPLTATVRR